MGKYQNREGTLCSDCKKCCVNGDVKRLARLLSSGCSVNARCDDQGLTPLMLAASQGHTDVVDTLLSSWNPDVNSQDFRGNTALMLACKAGHWKCARSLLYSWSADLDMKDNTGSTALTLTASHVSNKGHLRCVKLLVEQDADVNVKNDMGMAAVMYTMDSLEFGLSLLKILLDSGADVDCVDYDGESLVILAVRRRNLPILDYLLRFTDLSVNTTNNIWDNSLIIALKLESPPKDKSSPQSDFNDYGKRNSQIVKLLLSCGSDPNSKSGTGCAALNIASASSFENTVLLLSNGAVPKLSQVYLNQGIEESDVVCSSSALQACGSIFSPVDVAVLNGQFSIANFLLNFLGCRPYSLFSSYSKIPLNVHSKCAGPLKCAVDEMISMAHKSPYYVAMARDCVSRPKSLLQTCVAVISKLAGSTQTRHDRLFSSGLPPVLVKKLFVLDGVDENDFVIDDCDT